MVNDITKGFRRFYDYVNLYQAKRIRTSPELHEQHGPLSDRLLRLNEFSYNARGAF